MEKKRITRTCNTHSCVSSYKEQRLLWTPQLLQGYWCSNEPSIVRRECTVTVLWSNAFPSSLLKKRTCGREARGRLVHCGQQGSSLLRHVAANWQDGSTNDRRIHASSASCINTCGRAFPSMASSPCALLYGKKTKREKKTTTVVMVRHVRG